MLKLRSSVKSKIPNDVDKDQTIVGILEKARRKDGKNLQIGKDSIIKDEVVDFIFNNVNSNNMIEFNEIRDKFGSGVDVIIEELINEGLIEKINDKELRLT